MAIMAWHWVVMSLATLFTLIFLYVVFKKGETVRQRVNTTRLKHMASTMETFKHEAERKKQQERKNLEAERKKQQEKRKNEVKWGLPIFQMEEEFSEDEHQEIKSKSTTPLSVQQENPYGIGWYRIIHRTRSRKGQQLESEKISVLHPGDIVYIDSTALWKNRIRGKLGKGRKGWLTMEDVDRKKVFVEMAANPQESLEKNEEKKLPQDEPRIINIQEANAVNEMPKINQRHSREIRVLRSDSDEKQGESDSEKEQNIVKHQRKKPEPIIVEKRIETVLEVEVPDLPKKKKKRKPKPREVEDVDDRHRTKKQKESRNPKSRRRRRKKEKENYKHVQTEEFGGDFMTKDPVQLEEEIYQALRRRRKERERRKNQRDDPDLDVMDDVIIHGGVIDELLNDFASRTSRTKRDAAKHQAHSVNSREEGETQIAKKRKKRWPRYRQKPPSQQYAPMPHPQSHPQYYGGHHMHTTHAKFHPSNYYYPSHYDVEMGGPWGDPNVVFGGRDYGGKRHLVME